MMCAFERVRELESSPLKRAALVLERIRFESVRLGSERCVGIVRRVGGARGVGEGAQA